MKENRTGKRTGGTKLDIILLNGAAKWRDIAASSCPNTLMVSDGFCCKQIQTQNCISWGICITDINQNLRGPWLPLRLLWNKSLLNRTVTTILAPQINHNSSLMV